ncbi:DUF1015 domain-containing protein [soil metagenome]
MTVIRPFPGIRPKAELASQVASLPYDVMNTEEAREEAKDKPLSYLHVVKSEIAFPKGYDAYAPEVYEKAGEKFRALLDKGVIEQDPKAYLYVYEQEMNGHVQTGLVAASSVNDYWADVVKRHEFTRPVKEQDRMNHMRATGIHAGPVFLTYPDVDEINAIIDPIRVTEPDTNFTSPDGVRHTVWVIRDLATIEQLVTLFKEQVPATYIADGHHRAASSSKLGREMQERNPNDSGEEPYNYFLSVLFPASRLQIIDYNRVVNNLNGYLADEFLDKVSQRFTVEKLGAEIYKPAHMREFSMYLEGAWYRLAPNEGTYRAEDPVNGLDVSILQNNLLEPILGINDPRTDDRIDFVGGIRGLGELQKRVDSGEMAVAFALYPVTIDQLIRIADSGNVMPPKSTWFEPKLRSGLIVHQFSAKSY